MKAYDITLSDEVAGPEKQGGQGWCFGLPPGITPEQWPLDPCSGYPLMHGFTLLLPEDYRVHGPDVVGLSFFATPPDHNDGGPVNGHPAIAGIVESPDSEMALGADLLPIWKRARQAHPRLFRMRDILSCPYAVILLTQSEIHGPACAPPALVDSRILAQVPPPAWLSQGSFAVHQNMYGREPDKEQPQPIHVHQPFTWTPRAQDLNAGVAPRDPYGEAIAENGYRSFYYWQDDVVEAENYRELDWAVGHAANHIGGTMRPVQGVPEFSTFYIEFEEEFGGYNFGGGNAQLDFLEMQFDWACG